MIGNILGAMEWFGIIGILSLYYWDAPFWFVLIMLFLVSFPIVCIILTFILMNRKDKKENKAFTSCNFSLL